MYWCWEKRLSKCNDALLSFGCDELYERGFLGVAKDGSILVSSQLMDTTAKDYATKTVQKSIGLSQGEEKYFLWHLENMFRK